MFLTMAIGGGANTAATQSGHLAGCPSAAPAMNSPLENAATKTRSSSTMRWGVLPKDEMAILHAVSSGPFSSSAGTRGSGKMKSRLKNIYSGMQEHLNSPSAGHRWMPSPLAPRRTKNA